MQDFEIRLKEDMKRAMKERDTLSLTTIRMLSSEIKKVVKADSGAEKETLILQVIKKMIKQRSDAIAQFVSAGRQDLAESETKEKELLQNYLPASLGTEKIDALVEEAISALESPSAKDIGKVMRSLKASIPAHEDWAHISAQVKQALTQS